MAYIAESFECPLWFCIVGILSQASHEFPAHRLGTNINATYAGYLTYHPFHTQLSVSNVFLIVVTLFVVK